MDKLAAQRGLGDPRHRRDLRELITSTKLTISTCIFLLSYQDNYFKPQIVLDELKKIVKVAGKVIPSAPHETLLVLDATIGQNALLQAQGFQQVSEVTGVVLTKLDGTAKGGVVITVRDKIGLPIKLVGLGEKIEDLQDFDTEAFVDALLNNTNGIGID